MKSRTTKKGNGTWRAVLRLFSGRRNPEWELSEECQEAIREKIDANRRKRAGAPLAELPRSGYRGIRVSITSGQGQVREVHLFGDMLQDSMTGCRCGAADDVARKVYGCMPEEELERVDGASYDALHVPHAGFSTIQGIDGVPIGLECDNAPRFVGNRGLFQTHRDANNCYNYGINLPVEDRLSTALPGGLSEIDEPAKFVRAFRKDTLGFVGSTLKKRCSPARSHYIAVVLRGKAAGTDGDFHVIRLDRDGRWSHKDGDGPITRLDDRKKRIIDLRTSEFEWPSKLLGFFRVPHNLEVIEGHVKK